MGINDYIEQGRKRKLALKFFNTKDTPGIGGTYQNRKDLIARSPDNALFPWYPMYMNDVPPDGDEDDRYVHIPGKTNDTLDRGWSVIGRPDVGVKEVNGKNVLKPLNKDEKITRVADAIHTTGDYSQYNNTYEVMASDEKQAPSTRGGDFDAEFIAKKLRPGSKVPLVERDPKLDAFALGTKYEAGEINDSTLKKELFKLGMRPAYIEKIWVDPILGGVTTPKRSRIRDLYEEDMVNRYATDFVNRRPTRTVSDERVKNINGALSSVHGY
jgi:hypothetical protein